MQSCSKVHYFVETVTEVSESCSWNVIAEVLILRQPTADGAESDRSKSGFSARRAEGFVPANTSHAAKMCMLQFFLYGSFMSSCFEHHQTKLGARVVGLKQLSYFSTSTNKRSIVDGVVGAKRNKRVLQVSSPGKGNDSIHSN